MSKHPSVTKAQERYEVETKLQRELEARIDEIGPRLQYYIEEPTTTGMLWWKRYYCPVHPKVELKSSWWCDALTSTTVRHDGCGYLYWTKRIYRL